MRDDTARLKCALLQWHLQSWDQFTSNYIFFSWVSAVCSQTLTPVFLYIFLPFSFFILTFCFLSWRFDVSIGLLGPFPSTTFPFCLFRLQILDAADWEKPASFATLTMTFSNPLHCFGWQASCWDHVSCQSANSRSSLWSASTLLNPDSFT